jgi:hypothetical protein
VFIPLSQNWRALMSIMQRALLCATIIRIRVSRRSGRKRRVISRLRRDVVLGKFNDWDQRTKSLKIGFVRSTLIRSETLVLFSITLEAQSKFSSTGMAVK